MDPDTLRTALHDCCGGAWLAAGVARVSADPPSITRLFPAAGRRCGRSRLPEASDWTADEAARALLLLALPRTDLPRYLDELYRYGDAVEKHAVLRALALVPIGAEAVPLLHDAIRTNDTRLLSAALGPYARHLDQRAWRQAVLKCVFLGVPLSRVHDLTRRADRELVAMMAGLREEREAAGRHLPADALALVRQFTRPVLEVRCASSTRIST
ncbi:EboA domain-containing protein [Actinoplanes teichomyceticus]|uniref:Sugar phosphate isomerase n=1 Tax=Actinoplanes teichomyceticus TaxID=1867 RepID=A0A561WML9_ACTTI|nr:EboA domain-containing protein [Actinoplanes teichomyceticus]TWG25099.1 hypothetical protein FHX34_10162 [Actinoplanes teichomyceticus]GIF10171.1 hypothetical protein Ate01nite_02030 [Actinoplanes teichomyceticus]